ncbi:NlpC/P60 family protein [Streptomyces sp. G-G2]|uniref:C40 family peptidase n=1 Tax=Streptomyces sp. G-G2 TaxID=3046201 RepID=UPI0024BA61DC|nr:NlpC/P60 family protein [Streptomyces sp. G-G2]MDJ0385171.1 NlpC/P60 family protein [Streptomyces sp. G-G2]
MHAILTRAGRSAVLAGILALCATGITAAPAAAAPAARAAVAAPAAADTDCGVLATGAGATAEAAVRAACTQIGVWYSWGGGHGPQPGATYGQVDPTDPASEHDPERIGFDCSGLVRYAYAQATGQDVLAGTANSQYHSPRVTARIGASQGLGALLPGDLLAWGGDNSIHHIAIYLGAGKMVQARQSGTRVMVSDVSFGGDYNGAVRIAAEPGQPGTFSTWGTDVWTHAEPSTTSARVVRFAGPTRVRISCQKHAQWVDAEGYHNDAWSYLPDHKAWLTNIYVRGAAWLDGVPTCP